MDHEERWHEICQPKLKSIEEKLDMILTQLQGNGMPGYGDRIRDLERLVSGSAVQLRGTQATLPTEQARPVPELRSLAQPLAISCWYPHPTICKI